MELPEGHRKERAPPSVETRTVSGPILNTYRFGQIRAFGKAWTGLPTQLCAASAACCMRTRRCERGIAAAHEAGAATHEVWD